MTAIPTQPTANFEEATQQHPPPNLHDVACTDEENDSGSSQSEKDSSFRNKRVKSQKKTHNRTGVSQPPSAPQHGSFNIQGPSFTPQPAMLTIQRVRSPRFSQPPAATSPNGVLDTASRVASASPSTTPSRTPVVQSPAPIPKSEKRGRGRGHNFTIEQELYIAGLLADPETWALLDGPGERNDHYIPKKFVHETIAAMVNSRFSDEASLKIDGAQIKNKIENMKKQWKTANTFLKKIGDGDLTSNGLRKLVEDKCCFYYILQETWSISRSLNPRDPVQLTRNLTRPSICHFGNDTSEEEDDSAVEQDDAITGQASQQPESRAKKPKKRREDGGNILALLQDLYKSNEIDQELKRQELEINRLKADAETRLIEMQIRKMESEIEIEKATFQAELAREDKLLEIEYLRTQTEFIQASAILMMEEVKLEGIQA